MTRSEARAALWAQFAAAGMVAGAPATFAGMSADELLVEFEKRFKWAHPARDPWGHGSWHERQNQEESQ